GAHGRRPRRRLFLGGCRHHPHIRDIAETGNLAPGNAGPILITDFLTPIVILVLLLIQPSGRPSMAPSLAAELARARKDLQKSLQSDGKR
ncbi:MAG: DUF6790 family protein, partial [Methyloceanibacter sp.]